MLGPIKDPHVTGTVRLRDGVIWIPPPDNKNLVGQGDPALFNVLDTAVHVRQGALSGTVAAARESAHGCRSAASIATCSCDRGTPTSRSTATSRSAIHVNRAKQTLVLDGVLLSERGEYTFLTRQFNIKRGSATFINSTELNPTLQVDGRVTR